jgi:hypothetical protein
VKPRLVPGDSLGYEVTKLSPARLIVSGLPRSATIPCLAASVLTRVVQHVLAGLVSACVSTSCGADCLDWLGHVCNRQPGDGSVSSVRSCCRPASSASNSAAVGRRDKYRSASIRFRRLFARLRLFAPSDTRSTTYSLGSPAPSSSPARPTSSKSVTSQFPDPEPPVPAQPSSRCSCRHGKRWSTVQGQGAVVAVRCGRRSRPRCSATSSESRSCSAM